MSTAPPEPTGASSQRPGELDELDADFQSAFVAMRYVLGARGPDLTAHLDPLCAAARRTAERLEQPDRQQRARALALELAKIVADLDRSSLR